VLASGLGTDTGHPSAATLVQNDDSAELTTRETQPTFRIQVQRNLVVVRVVVRDSKGTVVGNLRREDFQLLDNGKPQTISQFAVEVPSSKLPTGLIAEKQEEDLEAQPETTLAPSTPQRYLGVFFDDVHMPFEDVARSREAADRYLGSALQPGDRVGVFTSSGQNVLAFTDDRTRLHQSLLLLRPRPSHATATDQCPAMPDYRAYLIAEQRDAQALEIATEEILACRYQGDRERLAKARQDAEIDARQRLSVAEMESLYSLRGIERLVRRMRSLPGQRNIVLVSCGFLTETLHFEVSDIVDRALRANVVINALDSRGLYVTLPIGEIQEWSFVIAARADLLGRQQQIEIRRASMATDAMRTLSGDTGGTFFNNNNDLELGFRRLAPLPEVYYVLAFSPQILKMDGRFHSLKVRLVSGTGLTLQARKGYYAPRQPSNAAAQEKEEIEQAIFSQDEANELPADVHTQFFKINDTSCKTFGPCTRGRTPITFSKTRGAQPERPNFCDRTVRPGRQAGDGKAEAAETPTV